ncbi:MAG: hypothetical protein HYV09_27815 [Deltaproteobacteria bacterium]|nr:hypothetical protein [Deltaproteobacteria bacterium]
MFVFANDHGHSPMLHAVCGGRWLAPPPLPDVDVVTALARVDDRRWLVAGRGREGGGWLGVYEPLSFRVDRLPTSSPTFLAAAGLPELGVGVACGLGGSVVWFDGRRLVQATALGESVPLSAASFDGDGRVWCASNGAIFCASHVGDPEWRVAWSDARFQAPFGSLHADDGRVLAMSVDGGVVEGRLDGA